MACFLGLGLSAVVRCETNGLFYTSIFYRNECGGFHVRRAVVCGWLLPWVHCYFVEVQY